MMQKDNIVYFNTNGNTNFNNVIATVRDYLSTDDTIKNVAVFAGNLSSVCNLHTELKDFDVKISVTTYPYGREFIKTNTETEEKEIIIPEVTTHKSKQTIINMGMNYIQGGLPFEPIRSCTGDNSMEMIMSSFDLISKGLVHCVSAAIMTKENGYLDDDEKIIAMSGDTAILVTPTIRRDIFNGEFKIHKILCKPL